MFRTLAIILLLALPAAAHEIQAGKLEVIHPVMFKAYPNAVTAAGYMAIANNGSEPDMLIGVRFEGVKATIHESRDDGGVSRMVHLEGVEIPADDTVLFEQGGLHVMVMGLAQGQFQPGDMVDAVLIFDRQGEVPVSFMVEMGGETGGHEGHIGN